MQQRQLRLGDILDDYCTRERRLTNHVVVAMIGDEIKRTRCSTCETEHEYKHAKVPRQRKKGDEPAALFSQVLASGPKRISHDAPEPRPSAPSDPVDVDAVGGDAPGWSMDSPAGPPATGDAQITGDEPGDQNEGDGEDDEGTAGSEEGPVHRPLIRATLPRHEGQAPPSRPTPDFTIRQPPGGRQNRFRPRNNQQRGGQMFQGNRSGGPSGGGRGPERHPGNRPPQGNARPARHHHDSGRKRSK